MGIRTGLAVSSLMLTGAAQVPPPPILAFPANSFEGRVLALHNGERVRLGLVPLAWDPALAQGAAQYAAFLAQTGIFEHSNKASRPGVAENLAMGSRGYFGVDRLVGSWLGEKAVFVPGIFPNNSRTGNWLHISHYSQVIWPTTTRLGCAMASGRGNNYLVCRYSPKGNRDGQAIGYPRMERG